jgi:fatty acid/phospholipid biosynthesis enzyme
MFSGDYDVIVTDGFTGNIALKSIEGVCWYDKTFYQIRI